MKILVFYDIIENKIRNRIINLLFDFGFQRIQFSTFLGDLSEEKLKKLYLSAKEIINEDRDSMYIFNICEKDFNNCIFLGKNVDKDFWDTPFLVL